MRRYAIGALLATALALGAPAVANAETGDYTPADPRTPSLGGSTANGECDGDVPWITYDVTLVDPDGLVTTNTATLTFTAGSNTTTIMLGNLVDGRLSGSVLWPGASVDAAGNPAGWPGWEFVDGQWSETTGNYGWTRDITSVVLSVNPDMTLPLSYPPSTPECATSPTNPSEPPTTTALPSTGLSQAVWPIAGIGLLGVAAGGILFARHRARRP